MLGNPAHQRQRNRRRGQQQVLARLQAQAYFDSDFGKPVEFDGVNRGGKIALMCGHGQSSKVVGTEIGERSELLNALKRR
jgi:hypothetical protein